MTNEEAIEMLKTIKDIDALELDALNLAIQALKKQVSEDVKKEDDGIYSCPSCRCADISEYCGRCG